MTNNNVLFEMTLHLNSGDASLLSGDYSPSITSYKLALDILSNVSSPDITSPAGSTGTITLLQFRTYSHMAMAHLFEEDYVSALTSASSAKYHSENIAPVELGALYGIMGEASYQLQQYTDSLMHFTSCLNHYEAVSATKFSSSLSFEKKKKGVLDWMETVKRKITQMTPQKVSSELTLPSSATIAALKRRAQALCPKYQYYQNDTFVTIAILEPNLTQELLTVKYEGNDHLTVQVTKGMPNPVKCEVICGTLFDAINVDNCKVVFKSEKVLVKLSKAKKMNWHELFGKGGKKEETKKAESTMETKEKDTVSESKEDKQEDDVCPLTTEPAPTLEQKKTINRPYSSTKDWNKIEQNLKKDEEMEKPEGDEALQKLFRDIYGKANPDTRRAMNKSFQTSGGTVLSTNWKEVKEKNYEKERTAPKGMEWKDWEGKKLPMTKEP